MDLTENGTVKCLWQSFGSGYSMVHGSWKYDHEYHSSTKKQGPKLAAWPSASLGRLCSRSSYKWYEDRACVVQPIYVQDRYKGELYLGRYVCIQNKYYVRERERGCVRVRVFACVTRKYKSYVIGKNRNRRRQEWTAVWGTYISVRIAVSTFTWSSQTAARGFVWVWNLVADTEGGTQAEGVWE
jgi:hypothetical protein